MHWELILALLGAAALAGVAWLIYHLRQVPRAVKRILEKIPGISEAERDAIARRVGAAMDEAKSAHGRLDRIDEDMRQDQQELGAIRAMIEAVKGWLKFLMHRDISDEIKRQQREEASDDGTRKNRD